MEMPGENIISEIKNKETKNKEAENQLKEAENQLKKAGSIDVLTGRVCYFSLAGNLALQAFNDIKCSSFKTKEKKRAKLKREFEQRLFLAILMFDKVVMHCSDPLRSELVLEVLEENIQWIEEGRILFVFSHHITNIREDYRKYIEGKIKDYSDGFYSENEAVSLRQEHINDNYYERVISLLEKTDYLVRRSGDESYSFDKLVIKDLTSGVQTENVIIDSVADLPQVLSLNLTLFQLLHMRHLRCNEDGEKETGKFVFPQEIVEEVIEHIRDCLGQENVIARSAIVDALEEGIKKKATLSRLQKKVLKVVALRMDILYCKMNSGEKLILEFHPSYENGSNYQIDCFNEYLKMVAGVNTPILLTHQRTDKILKVDELDSFRMIFLNCMADMREHMKLSQLNSNDSNQYREKLLELFKIVVAQNEGIRNRRPMDSIRKILKEAM